MPTVSQVIRRILPQGTVEPSSGAAPEYTKFPYWPPDMFAVTASLVSMSGCYSRPRYVGGLPIGTDPDLFFSLKRLNLVTETGSQWSSLPGRQDLKVIQHLWEQLIADRYGEVSDGVHACASDWWDAAITLMLIADEASAGVGFVAALGKESSVSEVAALVFEQHELYVKVPKGSSDRERPLMLRHIPRSLCVRVSPSDACVQPKTRTPQIGCTLRSLTHNLALLPPIGDVETSWLFGLDIPTLQHSSRNRPLNLLLVPFPYHIDSQCFTDDGSAVPVELAVHPRCKGNKSSFFGLNPVWLTDQTGEPVPAEDVAEFLRNLLDKARNELRAKHKEDDREITRVHGLVLPELALEEQLAREVAVALSSDLDLEFFVCGVIARNDNAPPRNQVLTFLYHKDQVLTNWKQSKHHRWQLEAGQIGAYNLGLNSKFVYWEHIDVADRHCAFWVFRPGASMAALICEDLARIDPVQAVIRSIGPNLVIALLMDGPQREWRWPNRYATVLADDPGSSVLTFTSVGLMRLMSAIEGDGAPPNQELIAMWKQAGSRSRELGLAAGDHAIVLALTSRPVEHYSLDGRSDGGTTVALEFAEVLPVRHPDPPDWVSASAKNAVK